MDPRRRLGAVGERLAAAHLEAAGYTIVERNFRTRYGELDLIAEDERFLVFCEVKSRIARARPGPFGPFAAIGPDKRRRIRAMAREWLAGESGVSRPNAGPAERRPPRRRTYELRFDAIGVELERDGSVVRLEHLEDAF